MARGPLSGTGAPPPARSVIVCADEYGVTDGASHAILDLVGMERVSAVAAEVDGTAWRRFAPDLAALRGTVGIGLDLALGPGPGRPALAGRSSDDVSEIVRQIDLFGEATGFAPEFVGSRGHAHVLPRYRRALFLALERAGLVGAVWLRDPSASPAAIMRRGRARLRALAACAAAFGFAREARARGYVTNDGFAGFVAGPRDFPVERDFQRYLQQRGPAHLVACRPAYLDEELERLDPRAERRMRELMYLSSTRYADLLAVLGLRLASRPGHSATGSGASMTSSSGPTRQR